MDTTYIEERVPPSVESWSRRRLGTEPQLHPTCEVRDSHLGPWTEIGPGCRLLECAIGAYSYAHEWVDMASTVVGRFCSIASHVRMNPGNHPMERATQHHCTYRRRRFGFSETDDQQFFDWRRQHPCRIGHDVWVGHGALIMPGVQVGTGAVIAAGAVVTKDVEPYTIVGGVPAKLIRPRCTREQADALMSIAYWDWEHEVISQRIDDLALPVEQFIEKYGVSAHV